jgi:hypothetical protein
MSHFVAKRKDLTIEIEGEVVTIKSPKIAQFEALQEALKDKPESEIYKVYKAWFVDIGIPARLVEELDNEDFIGLVKFISDPSKKK